MTHSHDSARPGQSCR